MRNVKRGIGGKGTGGAGTNRQADRQRDRQIDRQSVETVRADHPSLLIV